MKRKTLLVLANSVTLLCMLLANYAANARLFSDTTVAGVSYKYDTLFAPAGYAFTIWGVIFLLCISFVIYQWYVVKNTTPNNNIQRTGLWFTISNLLNAAWLYCWLNDMIGWSVIAITFLLFCLVMLTIRLRLEIDDVPVREIFFVWWPISVYLGWIMVATIACTAAWLTSLNWQGFHISNVVWTIAMIVIAGFLYILLVLGRNLRESALVGVWAFVAIAVRQWNDHGSIVVTAIVISALLLLIIGWHGYKNRRYNILFKLKRGEW